MNLFIMLCLLLLSTERMKSCLTEWSILILTIRTIWMAVTREN